MTAVTSDVTAERAVEVLTLAVGQDWDFLRGFLHAYDDGELRDMVMAMAAMTAGALDGVYNAPTDAWLPALCQRLLAPKEET